MFLCPIPTRLVIGLVDYAAFKCVYIANPYNFKHFGLTYLSVNDEGRTVTSKSLNLDYELNQYARAFFGTNMALGLISKDAGSI